MAVTSSNIPSAEKVPTTKSTLWQEEMRGKEPADTSSSISPAQSPVQGAASSLKDPILDSKEGKVMPRGTGHPTLVFLLEQELGQVDPEVSCQPQLCDSVILRRRSCLISTNLLSKTKLIS